MVSGLGFSELFVVGVIVLLFFGSKELPRFLRETGRLVGKLRRYSEKVRRELDEVTRSLDVAQDMRGDVTEKKNAVRRQHLDAREALSEEERKSKSEQICAHLLQTPEVAKARSVMIYVSTGAEVQTHDCIRTLLESGKRVVVPYCKTYGADLGIAEITDPDKDLEKGKYGILEPKAEIRDNFFRTDLQLVVCPGIAFDSRAARLGRGKGYYDHFLGEIRGRVPLFGLAFECQITTEQLPFDYHDIPMDQVITEKGIVIGREEKLSEPVS